ncbi:MAG TPA: transcriptional repressor [Caproicibacter sp.]|nr:transcriptional repressor [Caproicibacter sp.]
MDVTEKKRNFSRKREAILKAVRSTTCHPTAEWVYQTLKPDYPDLSLGTVYRNLAQFKEDGTIISVGTVDGQERYDGNVKPHTHFVCSGCGSVLDIPGDFISEEQVEKVAARMNLQVDSSDVLLHGICDKCLQKQ